MDGRKVGAQPYAGPPRERKALGIRVGLASANRGSVHVDAGDLCHAGEVGIVGQESGTVAVGNRGDHAIQHAAGGHAHASARPVDAGRSIEVDGSVEAEEVEAQQQPP